MSFYLFFLGESLIKFSIIKVCKVPMAQYSAQCLYFQQVLAFIDGFYFQPVHGSFKMTDCSYLEKKNKGESWNDIAGSTSNFSCILRCIAGSTSTVYTSAYNTKMECIFREKNTKMLHRVINLPFSTRATDRTGASKKHNSPNHSTRCEDDRSDEVKVQTNS